MALYIVPNDLADAINRKLDAALAELPDEDRSAAENDREFLYGQLLEHFNEHGVIPEFSLVPNIPEFRVVRGGAP